MIIAPALTWILAALVMGSCVYCVLAIVGTRRYRADSAAPLRQAAQAVATEAEPISLLKPLHGLDEGLESNLRTFFEQDYPAYELVFAARSADDPGLQLAQRLSRDYPHLPCRFLTVGEPPYANAKVWSLEQMTHAAQHDLLVMSDSDMRVGRDLLRILAAEFHQAGVAVATCPYRAVPGRSVWSMLEAVGMNTEFWSGVFTARLVEGGVHFAIGPTAAARRRVLLEIGGWPRLSQYLAEDFVLGQFATEAGHTAILSAALVEHHIGSQAMIPNLRHRLRWNRSTRRSRPAGYIGQIFTNPLPLALLFAAVIPSWGLAVLGITALLRAWLAVEVSSLTLHDPLCRRRWWAVPVQDLLSFFFWLAGFFGSTIDWRGRRYRLLSDGRFELISR